jgi:hypothetical protein
MKEKSREKYKRHTKSQSMPTSMAAAPVVSPPERRIPFILVKLMLLAQIKKAIIRRASLAKSLASVDRFGNGSSMTSRKRINTGQRKIP